MTLGNKISGAVPTVYPRPQRLPSAQRVKAVPKMCEGGPGTGKAEAVILSHTCYFLVPAFRRPGSPEAVALACRMKTSVYEPDSATGCLGVEQKSTTL